MDPMEADSVEPEPYVLDMDEFLDITMDITRQGAHPPCNLQGGIQVPY